MTQRRPHLSRVDPTLTLNLTLTLTLTQALSVPPEWRPALSAVHVTRVASAEECAWVVAEAEKHAAGGWNEAGHHDQYPTCDVVVAERLGLGSGLGSGLGLVTLTLTPTLTLLLTLNPKPKP